MLTYLIILVASVFIGTELLAIKTPFAQLTLYRIFALSSPIILWIQMKRANNQIKIQRQSVSTAFVGMLLFWWLWALASFAWAWNMKAWFQAMFLLTLGISSVIALYCWVKDLKEWEVLIKVIWVMMALLVVWGYFEIITNHYFLADLVKLDKYKTFVSQPWTRIPVTHFENQNDYATMLLAFITTSVICYQLTQRFLSKLTYLVSILLATYLIYRCQSRMILLCVILFGIVFTLLQFRIDLQKAKHFKRSSLLTALATGVLLSLPWVRGKLFSLVYLGGKMKITGDVARMNMWRNGLYFLGKTFGIGVGAGNIESWMEYQGFLPTNNIYNIHNWWLDILVAYGVIVFALYVICYLMLIAYTFRMRMQASKKMRQVFNAWLSFLICYVPASITSATNMYIEWHWVFFAMLVSFIKLYDQTYSLPKGKLGGRK